MALIHKRRGRTPTACIGNLHNGDVCGAPIGGAFHLCHACTTRTHDTMMLTLYRYGHATLARELTAHYERTHSPATRGLSCPDCFREGHYQNVKKTCTPVPAHVIVKA